jgi:hypothetical protein
VQGLTEEGTPKLGWPCIFCGHFPVDYEEQHLASIRNLSNGVRPQNWPQHARVVHSIDEDSVNRIYAEVKRLNDLKIWVSCQGISAELLSAPSEEQYRAVDAVSQLGLLEPPGDIDQIDAKGREVVMAKLILPQALEGLIFIFFINQVSRACTHQIVRTRLGAAFIQQSQRGTDVSHAWHRMPLTVFGDEQQRDTFVYQVNEGRAAYMDAIDGGIPRQDARLLLPQSVCTHIGAVYNWPALTALAAKRMRNFMGWEINAVLRAMRAEVIDKVGFATGTQMRAGCEAAKICQQLEADIEGCGKFPMQPQVADSKWRQPKSLNTHGYVFDVEKFGGRE